MTLTDLIHQLAIKYMADGLADNREGINRGLCEGFAADIQDLMPEVDILAVEELMVGHDGSPSGSDVFDWAGLKAHWAISPPGGIPQEEIDAMTIGGHFWITHQGRHYDAECPDGTASFFDLPYFRRQIEAQKDKVISREVLRDEPLQEGLSP